MEHSLLEIKDFCFKFPVYPGLGERNLFKSLNLELKSGEFLILLGPPESGKTTLKRCICGLYPGMTGAVTAGDILINGKSVASKAACDWIESVGTVFQDPEEQIVATRCDDDACFALESLDIPEKEILVRLKNAFEHFSLEAMTSRNPLSLSGGEKKRLLIAALEMQDPELWVLDESTDELDAPGQAFFLDFLKMKAEKEGKGILLMASKYKEHYSHCGASLALLDDGIICRDDNGEFQDMLSSRGLVVSEEMQKNALTKEIPGKVIFSLRNLSHAYPGNSEFRLDIDSLDIRKGELLVLKGPNGCGKSTLARILCGLITPDSPVLYEGHPASAAQLNRCCAYLFQNPDYQLFLPTVEEELMLGLKTTGLGRLERQSLVLETVKRFRLPSGNAAPALLSYGTRKRLQAGIYALLDKDLYILDEADSGLSYDDYKVILEELGGKGAAVLVISHDKDIQHWASPRIIEMDKGRIIREKEF